MAFPVIALLAVGGIALMAASGASGGGGFRLFDGQCRLIKRTVTNDQQLLKLAQRIAALVDRAVLDVGGASGGATETLRQILGDPPGDQERNKTFVRAVVTRALQLSATPACLKKLGVPEGAIINPWGEDWSSAGTLPPDMEEMRVSLTMGLAQALRDAGYDVGVEYMQTGPMVPYLAAAERIAR